MNTKRTALYSEHLAAGAKLIPFAGFEMPVRYTGDVAEHLLVREHAGMFDVSHMGQFFFSGPNALDLLQYATTNDVSKLTIGKAQYAALPNGKGGLVDDLIVYRTGEQDYMAVVNAANIEKDWNWLSELNKRFHATLHNYSDQLSLIAVSGPKAEKIVSQIASFPLSDLAYYTFRTGNVANIENVTIATTGYTGERTFEIIIPNEYAVYLWKTLLEIGKPEGLQPTGLGARDTLRLEMGYMLYGNDIDDTTSALEAGLNWVTKLNKPDFIDIELYKNQKQYGTKRKLVCFEMIERGIPRSHYPIAKDGNIVGNVTSGTQSPILQKGIGMGYVPTEMAQINNEIQIIIREKPILAKIVNPPFIQKTNVTKSA